jgi:hypothetical protein
MWHFIYLVTFEFECIYSTDGYNWATGQNIQVPGGVRTPLALIQEDNGLFSFFYTSNSYGYEDVYSATVQISII